MIIPTSDNIRAAADQIQKLDAAFMRDQQKELHEAMGEKSEDFQAAYQLGLQTARVVLAGSAELLTHGADPEKVL